MTAYQISKQFPNAEIEEMEAIRNAMNSMTEKEKQKFLMLYQSKRKDPQLILFTTLLGLVVVAGVHRILMGQVAMGILYFLTAGFCWIGTIIDLINYKNLAWKYNKKHLETADIEAGMF